MLGMMKPLIHLTLLLIVLFSAAVVILLKTINLHLSGSFSSIGKMTFYFFIMIIDAITGKLTQRLCSHGILRCSDEFLLVQI